MVYPKMKTLVLGALLIASSLAGCIGESEQDSTSAVTSTDTSTNSTSTSTNNVSANDTSTNTPTILGNVLTSTYHVQDLVEAIGGSRLNVQMIGPANIPVHDYDPTANDLLKLKDTDIFFYHGLGLEPWVNPAIASFGSDAP